MDYKGFYNSLSKERVNCPVCDSDKWEILSNQDRYGMGVQTVLCLKCGMIYINPRPSELAMGSFYENDYRKVYEEIEIPTEEYILNGPFISRANFIFDTLKTDLEKSKSILDVGCAEGTFLRKIETEIPTIETWGIEPNIGFGNYAKKQIDGEVFVGDYDKFLEKFPKKKFDIITTSHVLEHILKPREFLTAMKRLLKSNGILYIEVPNIMSERVDGLGAIHIGHVSSFDPKTLRYLLKICGFETIELLTDRLPAKTPSMAIICRVRNNSQTFNLPTERELNKKKILFYEKVLKMDTSRLKESNRKKILKTIRNFLKIS